MSGKTSHSCAHIQVFDMFERSNEYRDVEETNVLGEQ